MAPIRTGDGTNIESIRTGDGRSIGEIRKGDGTVVWSAGDGPSEIPDSATAQYQYDAQLLTGFADGDTVSNWTDERVSGITIPGQGTFREGVIGGNPTVEHDALDDGFSSNEQDISHPFALIGVVNIDSLDSLQFILGGAGDNSDNAFIGANNGTWRAFGGGGSVAGSSDTSVRLVSGWFPNTSDAYLREDGVQTASNIGSDNVDNYEAVSVGYRASEPDGYFGGQIGFVEIHEGLTATQLEQREQEIADYWGIPLS